MIATYTFDPSKVMTVADIAKIVGVSHQAAWEYIGRHTTDLPAPLLRLQFNGKGVDLWTRQDGLALAEEYNARRAMR